MYVNPRDHKHHVITQQLGARKPRGPLYSLSHDSREALYPRRFLCFMDTGQSVFCLFPLFKQPDAVKGWTCRHGDEISSLKCDT